MFVCISLLNRRLLFSDFCFFKLSDPLKSDDFLVLGSSSSGLVNNSLRHTNNQRGLGPFGLACHFTRDLKTKATFTFSAFTHPNIHICPVMIWTNRQVKKNG